MEAARPLLQFDDEDVGVRTVARRFEDDLRAVGRPGRIGALEPADLRDACRLDGALSGTGRGKEGGGRESMEWIHGATVSRVAA